MRIRREHLVCLLLALLTIAVYWQVLGHGFVEYDDTDYVTRNPHVKGGLSTAGVVWAFATYHSANWHPLTWISHMADVSLFGMKPAGHHATNLVLHVLNVLLLFFVLLRMTSNPVSSDPSPQCPNAPFTPWARCAFVAALFAIHPLHVESVAWVAERKDVLSTFFFLLTILAYVRYVRKRGIARYLPVVVLFALGLMSKPMLVTLPFVLLLLDYWPLGRLNAQLSAARPDLPSPPPSPVASSRTGEGVGGGSPVAASRAGEGVGGSVRSPETRNLKPVTQRTSTQHPAPNTGWSTSKSKSESKSEIIWEKIPLFLLAAGSAGITYWVQSCAGAVKTLQRFDIGDRIANGMYAYAAYIVKMIWPRDLAVYYPHPGSDLPMWQVLASALILIGITALVLRAARNRRYLVVGWLWYLITLVPVIGLVQVGSQAMADRYTYIPLIGLFLMVAWGVSDLLNGRKGERDKGRTSIRTLVLSSVLPAATLGVLAIVAYVQTGYWRDSVILFRHSLSVTGSNVLAEYGLGASYEARKDLTSAVDCYSRVLELSPGLPRAERSLANVLARNGDLEESAIHYSRLLEAHPNDPESQNALGVVLYKLGRPDEAVPHYMAAIRLKPDYALAFINLGSAMLTQGDVNGAVKQYSRALELDPGNSAAQGALETALVRQGKVQEAFSRNASALGVKPGDDKYHCYQGNLYMSQGKLTEAAGEYMEALTANPDYAEAHNNLGTVLVKLRRFDSAISHYREAIRIQPKFAQAHTNLAVAYYGKGMYAEAWGEVRESRELGGTPPPAFVKALSARMPPPLRYR